MALELPGSQRRATGLVDVLDRILDKGLVVAGDIKVSLAEVELLTIRIRLIVCSLDKAVEIGLDWWKYDRYLAPGKHELAVENEGLRKQIRALEKQVGELSSGAKRKKRGSSDCNGSRPGEGREVRREPERHRRLAASRAERGIRTGPLRPSPAATRSCTSWSSCSAAMSWRNAPGARWNGWPATPG